MMKFPLIVALPLAFLATDGFARTYQPIPPIEPQILISTPDGLYRNTPPVLVPGSEISAEYRASRIWQQYNRSAYGLSVPSVVQVSFDRDEYDDSRALLDDYRYERQRMREQHQYHVYRHMIESPVYVQQPQVYYPNYSNYWW